MVPKGEWRATAEFNGTAGFHIWQIYSPWSSLPEIIEEYEASDGRPAERKAWWNITLGEVWDDSGEDNSYLAPMLYERQGCCPWLLDVGPINHGDHCNLNLKCLSEALAAIYQPVSVGSAQIDEAGKFCL